MNLFRRKSVSELQQEGLEDHKLKRAVGPFNLTALGIGAIIGAGIFVLTGQAAAKYAGPAIVYSFILAGIACAFAGLCYAEFAAMIPISGSAYTYGYATMGEFIAWIWMGSHPGVPVPRLDGRRGLVRLRCILPQRCRYRHTARLHLGTLGPHRAQGCRVERMAVVHRR